MSLPRDLKVQIPGHGTDKINAAYELGGPRLTLRTVKLFTGISINHVINVDFSGFHEAVNAIGCVYADIDRALLQRHAPATRTSTSRPATRRCAAQEALEYARFRHEDSDLVRGVAPAGPAARGQAADRREQARRRPRQADQDLRQVHDVRLRGSARSVLRLLKLAVFSVGQPIREVHFEGQITASDGAGIPSYVTASNATVKKLMRQFLGVEETQGPRGELLPKDRKKRRKARKEQGDGGLEKAAERRQGPGDTGRSRPGGGGQLPVYYPTVRVQGLAVRRAAALLPDRDPGRQAPQELPDGHQARAGRRVLRRAGHHLEGPADPRQLVREPQDRQAQVRAALRRRPPAAGGLADTTRPSTGSPTPCSRRSPSARCWRSPARRACRRVTAVPDPRSTPAPRRVGRWGFPLEEARRRLALLGVPRSDGEPSSDLEARFKARCRELESPAVLELGTLQSRPGRSTMHRDWVPHASEFLGTDLEQGPDVDIVADVHKLSEVTGEERFDVVLSASTFEHLKYPTLAAHELMKVLRVGGLLYIQTHQSFPLHGYPFDYFRFSQDALASLFGTQMGMEVVATNNDFPVRIHSRRVRHLQLQPAFLNTTLWGEKRAPTPRDYQYEL